MEAAKQALIDELAAAAESIRKAILAACIKIKRKAGAAFEPELGGKLVTINSWLGRVAALSHDVRRVLEIASAVVDAPSLEEMIQYDKKARVPVEFTAIPEGDGKFRGIKMHVKHEEEPCTPSNSP